MNLAVEHSHTQSRHFGAFSILGGHGDFERQGATYRTPPGYLPNLAGTLLDPTDGLAHSFPRIMATRPLRMVFLVTLGVSVILQGAVAILLTCTDGAGGVGTCCLT